MNKSFELEPALYNKLNVVRVTCDQPLTTKHEVKAPFQNCNFFYTIVGAPGSGKTTFMFSLLTTKAKGDKVYYRVFKDILYVCPKNSRNNIKDNPLEDLDTVYEELGEDVKDKILDNKKLYDNNREKKLSTITNYRRL